MFIPKTRKYHVIFHYALRDNLRTTAKVSLHLRGKNFKSMKLNGSNQLENHHIFVLKGVHLSYKT